jgi:hypothetical protein
MESPVERFMDLKKVQNERNLVEAAIRSEVVDLRTETIKKGSPHILRIIKTQADHERQLKNWHKDVALLGKVVGAVGDLSKK